MATLAFNAQMHLATIHQRLRRLFLRFVAITAQARIYEARREAEFRLKHRRRRTTSDGNRPVVR